MNQESTGAPWCSLLYKAMELLVIEMERGDVFPSRAHTADTPKRVVEAYREMLSGADQNPSEVLIGYKVDTYDQMILIRDVDFVSLCTHHLLPFHGKVHFGYIPKDRIVGLSKVPRMVEILSRRLQIQEHLTQQIVSVFQENVQPRGCGAVIEAWHACVAIRGVRQPNATMQTTALAGNFHEPSVKDEFLSAVAGRMK